MQKTRPSVNLPRWGLKLSVGFPHATQKGCKFTPLGFETVDRVLAICALIKCKFTPLGFETPLKTRKLFTKRRCKYTPLGFETFSF